MMTIRSIPEEASAILKEATRPSNRLKMGDALANLTCNVGLTNEDVAAIEQVRDKTPAELIRFE
ncbi:hypothetical protein [Halomonas sp. G11]|uniref:hypothetical protein n=1 Tax=Halomonas sp. G11 TaxID=1684425 RepID=UPI001F1A6F29|nr:hypothetical protein [Halomonas sp. G11]